MKLRLAVIAFLMSFAQFVFAFTPEPERCPDVSALKSQPFFFAQESPDVPGYVALSIGKYQTNDTWGFVMGVIEADNMIMALIEANKALPKVTGSPRPMPAEADDKQVWVCPYMVPGTHYRAMAVTPLDGDQGYHAIKLLSH